MVVIPHRNAAEWVNAITADAGPNMLVVALARDLTRDVILDDLAVGQLNEDDLAQASWSLLAQGTGMSWWEGARLLLASQNNGILGRTVASGMDPWELTAAQWCAGVYFLCTEHADERGRIKFDATLSQPPAGIKDESDWGSESIESMLAQARQMPGMS